MLYRKLSEKETAQLQQQGCRCKDWALIQVAEQFSADNIYNVRFEGDVRLGENVTLENVGVIRTTEGATFGENNMISVKNEAGDGNVVLYSALTSQTAALMVNAAEEGNRKLFDAIRAMIAKYTEEHSHDCTTIGNNVTITNCRELTNVIIGDGCEVCGTSRMVECTLVPTPDATIYIGDDVIMENAIVQAGATIVDGARIYETFVGEACHIGRGFTSENSLFFANSHMDNGESCAALCGPFAVSHHKASLLIGGEYSFYNAGSSTNFSNHAYKMGPIHYGTLERGSKTASGAHILWPATIGTFSMVMGKVQTHPDTTMLPFSYVIGEGRNTNVVPARNLCTVGTYRDVMKWPKRDKRPASGKRSLITFEWLSPYVIEGVRDGIRYLNELLEEQGPEAQQYQGDGFTISASALKKGLEIYNLALRMYGNVDSTSGWTDMLGLLAPTDAINQIQEDILSGTISSIETLESVFRNIYDSYEQWRGCASNESDTKQAYEEWLDAVRKDAEREYELGDVDDDTLADFINSVK